MPKLADYSGKFDPKFSHDKLKRDTLLRIVKAYAEYLYKVDGNWYLAVKNKWGNAGAFDCDVDVWEKKLQLYDLDMVTSVLNIHGDDVIPVMKYFQVTPWTYINEQEIEIKNNNHAILTIRTCPALLAIEKEGTGREKLICQELTPNLFTMIAHYFNPNMKVNGLKVPPRTNYEDCCCQWEFKLDR
jgi:hypothetical protein